MTRALNFIAASVLTFAAVAAFAQTVPVPPNLPGAPQPPTAQTERRTQPAPGPRNVYGPGWSAAKCASARLEGQTVSKKDCPDMPATPVPPKS
jgi:hypothetical protein